MNQCLAWPSPGVLSTALRRVGGWIACEPIGALGLLIMLVWSMVAVGAIGDGGGWLGIGR